MSENGVSKGPDLPTATSNDTSAQRSDGIKTEHAEPSKAAAAAGSGTSTVVSPMTGTSSSSSGPNANVNQYPVIAAFFELRLRQLAEHKAKTCEAAGMRADECAKRLESLQYWRVEVSVGVGKAKGGLLSIAYVDLRRPNLKGIRSRLETVSAMGLAMCPVDRSKWTDRAQYSLLAEETRERMLIAQQLVTLGGRAGSIFHENDTLVVYPDDRADATVRLPPGATITEPASALAAKVEYPQVGKTPVYVMGNYAVLDWGTVVAEGEPGCSAFHDEKNIYPIGFKCLVQEQDEYSERAVDMLVEVEAVTPKKGPKGQPRDGDSRKPIFRLTVAWSTDKQGLVRRVYEGDTVGDMWRAAQKESRGAVGGDSFADAIVEDFDEEMESSDEEEWALRDELRDLNRFHFLEADQMDTGSRRVPEVKPRLRPGLANSLVDSNIMQMIEGMKGVETLKSYLYFRQRLSSHTGIMAPKYLLDSTSGSGLTSMIARTKFLQALGVRSLRFSNKEEVRRLKQEQNAERAREREERRRLKIATGRKTSSSSSTVGRLLVKERYRELESVSRRVKETVIMEIKRRREDARYDIESVWESEKKELMDDGFDKNGHPLEGPYLTGHYLSDPKRAEQKYPVSDAEIQLPGDLMGHVLELWTFLVTFGDALDVHTMPDLNTIMAAFQAVDPMLRAIHSKLVSIPSCSALAGELGSSIASIGHKSRDQAPRRMAKDNTLNSGHLNAASPDLLSVAPKQAHILLDRIGMLLTKLLLPDYLKLMNVSLDICRQMNIHIRVNILNWREIARSVMVYSTSREMGVTELEGLANHRGRTLQVFPDPYETRAIKLIRARLLVTPITRKRARDANEYIGFRGGWVLRLKAPSSVRGAAQLDGSLEQIVGGISLDKVPLEPQVLSLRWQYLIASLVYVPTTAGWLAHRIVSSAIDNLIGVELSPEASPDRSSAHFSHAAAIVAVLRTALRPPFYDPADVTWTKRLCQMVLRRYSRAADALLTDDGPHALRARARTSPLALCDPSLVTAILDARAKVDPDEVSVYEHVVRLPCCVPRGVLDVYYAEVDSMITYAEPLIAGKKIDFTLDEEEQEEVEVEKKESAHTEDGRLKRKAPNKKSTDKDGDEEDDEKYDEDDDERKSLENLDPAEAKARRAELRAKREAENEARMKAEAKAAAEAEAAAREEEARQVALLSEAMQRCFQVIQDLMSHPIMEIFSLPVDPDANPKYYNTVRQPLALSDIRRFLAAGGYGNSIMRFYRDVCIAFDNATCFNSQNSGMVDVADAGQAIFERLILERILKFTTPLCTDEECMQCNETLSEQKFVGCSRCEGGYHLDCCVPQMTQRPKEDWFCLPCLQQEVVFPQHYLVGVTVVHPKSDQEGRVSVCRQVRGRLVFDVCFDDCPKETWSAVQVRSHAYVGSIPLENDGKEQLEKALATRPNPRAETKTCAPLPSGFFYKDLDDLFSRARGYSGWGQSHINVPPFLRENFSQPALKKAVTDSKFESTQKAIAILSPPYTGDYDDGDMGIREWSNLLVGLMRHVQSASQVAAYSNMLDEHTDQAMMVMRGQLAAIEGKKEDFILQPKIRTGCDLVFMDASESAKRGRLRTEESNTSAGSGRKKKKDESMAALTDRYRGNGADTESDNDIYEDSSEESESDEEIEEGGNRDDIAGAGKRMRCGNNKSPRTKATKVVSKNTATVVATEGDAEVGPDFPEDVASSGPNAGKDDAERDAQLRYDQRWSSRRKGREDAAFHRAVLKDVFTECPLEEDEEAKAKHAASNDKDDKEDYVEVAQKVVAKVLAPKFSDTCDCRQWERSWLAKINSYQDVVSPEEMSSGPCCTLCGKNEHYLASELVHGQTWHEWFQAEYYETVDRVLLGERPRGKPAYPKDHRWLLVNPDSAAMEVADASFVGRPLRRGSVIMHEYCADAITILRRQFMVKAVRHSESRMLDALIGVGRARSAPIGTDREGRTYWLVPLSDSIFVCNPALKRVTGTSSTAVMNHLPHVSGGLTGPEAKTSSLLLPPDRDVSYSRETDVVGHWDPCAWALLQGDAVLEQLMRWLTPEIPAERTLRQILFRLYPALMRRVVAQQDKACVGSVGCTIVHSALPASETASDDDVAKVLSSVAPGLERVVVGRGTLVGEGVVLAEDTGAEEEDEDDDEDGACAMDLGSTSSGGAKNGSGGDDDETADEGVAKVTGASEINNDAPGYDSDVTMSEDDDDDEDFMPGGAPKKKKKKTLSGKNKKQKADPGKAVSEAAAAATVPTGNPKDGDASDEEAEMNVDVPVTTGVVSSGDGDGEPTNKVVNDSDKRDDNNKDDDDTVSEGGAPRSSSRVTTLSEKAVAAAAAEEELRLYEAQEAERLRDQLSRWTREEIKEGSKVKVVSGAIGIPGARSGIDGGVSVFRAQVVQVQHPQPERNLGRKRRRKVKPSEAVPPEQSVHYRVSFEGWGAQYTAWMPESRVYPERLDDAVVRQLASRGFEPAPTPDEIRSLVQEKAMAGALKAQEVAAATTATATVTCGADDAAVTAGETAYGGSTPGVDSSTPAAGPGESTAGCAPAEAATSDPKVPSAMAMGITKQNYVGGRAASVLGFNGDRPSQGVGPESITFAVTPTGDVPDLLATLIASQHVMEPQRMVSFCDSWSGTPGSARRHPLELADTISHLGLVKAAMLVVEAALPKGCLEEGSDRWSEDIEAAWVDTVTMATDATDLMACMLFLEVCVRGPWLKHNANKIILSLPNKTHAMKHASLGNVAIRLWAYDQLIRYGKVALPGSKEEEDAMRKGKKGRPKKMSLD